VSIRDRSAAYAKNKASRLFAGDPDIERALRKAYQAGSADKLLTVGIESHDQAVREFGKAMLEEE